MPSHFSCVWLCLTLWTAACQAPLTMDSPSENTGVDCHVLLQGIFPTQGSDPSLLHCRQILYHLSHQGSPPRILIWIHFKLNLERSAFFFFFFSFLWKYCAVNLGVKETKLNFFFLLLVIFVCCGSQDQPQVWSFTGRTHRTQHTVISMTMTLTEKGWKEKSGKGKDSVAMPGGNQAHVFKCPLPVKSNGTHLIPPAINSDYMYEMSSTKET